MHYLQGFSEGGMTFFASRPMLLGAALRRPTTLKGLIYTALTNTIFFFHINIWFDPKTGRSDLIWVSFGTFGKLKLVNSSLYMCDDLPVHQIWFTSAQDITCKIIKSPNWWILYEPTHKYFVNTWNVGVCNYHRTGIHISNISYTVKEIT